MKLTKYFIITYLILSTQVLWAGTVDTTTIMKMGLPVLKITTINGEEPTCDYVFAPEGADGISITNATKVPGRAVLTERGKVLFDSGDYEKGVSGMTIKLRGNTTAYYYLKKPFKIKLQKKGDMLSRNDSRYYDKDWVLISDGDDTFHTMIGFKINELMHRGWTPGYKYVNLIFNGDYRGIYMLVESVERNADCRLNVDKQTGYVFECDSYWWNEDVYFDTWLGKKYTFKYPDDEDITSEQVDYIQQTMNTVEQSIIDGTYRHYIDVESFASWILSHDILGTNDSGGSNIFLTKYDNTDTTKVVMSTLWDFDSTMKTFNRWAVIHYNFFYFKNLFDDPSTYFTYIYKRMWEEKSDSLFSQIDEFLTDFLNSKTAHDLDIARSFNRYRWNEDSLITVKDNINEAQEWFNSRKAWLGQAIANLDYDPAFQGIENVSEQSKRHNDHTYSISGQIVNSEQNLKPGIYIRNGKKFIVH